MQLLLVYVEITQQILQANLCHSSVCSGPSIMVLPFIVMLLGEGLSHSELWDRKGSGTVEKNSKNYKFELTDQINDSPSTNL